jgi:Flp pilus assembly protein TadG
MMIRKFAKDRKGLAAIEFSMIAGVLCIGILNVSDLAIYLFDDMQVKNAAEIGAQAALATCDLNHLPATTKCTGLTTAVTNAVQSTSLASAIALQSGSPSEGFYCVNTAGALQYVADVNNPPGDCTAAGTPTNGPGDYIKIQTSYTFTSLFPGMSVASALPKTMTSTAWMRLGG